MKIGKIIGGVVIGVAAIAAVPFTGGGSILAGAAALGLGTTAALVGAGVAGVVGGVVGGLWDDESSAAGNNTKKNLGILGMVSSGKTTLLHKLGGVKKVERNSHAEEYEEFTYNLKSGKSIVIAKGKDFGGSKSYVAEYRSIISRSDVVFYFFNVNLYVEDLEYRRECNSRLSFIFPNLLNKKTVLIATHADQSASSKSQLRESILKLTIDKNYSKLFNENFFIVNLTNNEEFSDLTENLFK